MSKLWQAYHLRFYYLLGGFEGFLVVYKLETPRPKQINM